MSLLQGYFMHKPTWRVVAILNYISSSRGVSLIECANALGIPVGTIHPILQTLVEMQYLSYNEESRKYSAGLRLFLAGSSYVSGNNWYASINSILKDTAEKCGGETVHLAKLEGGNVLYVIKVESTRSVRTFSSVGVILPAYGTALGKALLSGLPPDSILKLYPEGLKPLTKNTITSFDVLFSQLEEVRESGFAYECEESNYDVRCIARPLCKQGHVVAAVSVAMPVFRYTDSRKELIEAALMTASARIEEMLPYISL